jgi:hypothetical protein
MANREQADFMLVSKANTMANAMANRRTGDLRKLWLAAGQDGTACFACSRDCRNGGRDGARASREHPTNTIAFGLALDLGSLWDA